ncbi:hypothetical protein [Noviherbaspirillum denitrificans]|uniref:Uncharacterized protein n=1 Tax=Noviherbaspirillum denitrificans TaxID=1968433 RepID=A0A254TCV4_9BURK|nr:hypothetical protein [Noviherbaspirillum denitrificans]OWW18373.1 hypothetical protein AYR66_01260 [Noviherbaspirillum denitrificans]
MAADKKTIGISKTNAAALNAIVIAGRFGSELDAAKFAMAYAIKLGIPTGTSDGAETKWNVGSVDPDGSLRSLLEALFPAISEPYRLTEYFMNEGIKHIGATLSNGGDIYETIFTHR